MTHWVSFKSPVGSMDDKLTSTEGLVHAQQNSQINSYWWTLFFFFFFSNMCFPTAIIWKQVDTGFLHIGLI